MNYIWLFIPASLIFLLINNYRLEKRIINLEKVVKHYVVDGKGIGGLVQGTFKKADK